MNFKTGDIVIYGKLSKEEDIHNTALQRFWLKPARIITIKTSEKYPYEIQLLNNERSDFFNKEELIYFPNNEKELFGMLIRKEITEEEYKNFVKDLNK